MIGTGRSEAVDWAEVERRGRRRYLVVAPAIAVVLVAWALLHQRQDGWKSGLIWWTAAVLAAGGLVWLVLVFVHPGLRARDAERHRAAFAVEHHLDPGPGLRKLADRHADRRSAGGVLWWVFLLQLASPLLRADWSRPLVTVPSAVVVVAWFTGVAVWLRRTGRRAQEWRDDPPGPERVWSPPEWKYSGRQLAVRIGVGLLVAYAVFVLIALSVRA